jgi:hypothetical protein
VTRRTLYSYFKSDKYENWVREFCPSSPSCGCCHRGTAMKSGSSSWCITIPPPSKSSAGSMYQLWSGLLHNRRGWSKISPKPCCYSVVSVQVLVRDVSKMGWKLPYEVTSGSNRLRDEYYYKAWPAAAWLECCASRNLCEDTARTQFQYLQYSAILISQRLRPTQLLIRTAVPLIESA